VEMIVQMSGQLARDTQIPKMEGARSPNTVARALSRWNFIRIALGFRSPGYLESAFPHSCSRTLWVLASVVRRQLDAKQLDCEAKRQGSSLPCCATTSLR
jgi:hypothetical protein